MGEHLEETNVTPVASETLGGTPSRKAGVLLRLKAYMTQNPKRTKAVTLSVLVVAACGLSYLIGYSVGHNRNTQMVDTRRSEVLFALDGTQVTSDNLTAEEKTAFDALLAKEDETLFGAQYNRYRERDRLLKSFVLNRYIKLEAEKAKLPEAEFAQKALNFTASTRDQARALYSGSDPTAPLKDFVKIEPQLRVYIDEVAKHEAFDKLVKNLIAQKRLNFPLQRPVRENLTIDTTDFPKIGLSNSKHKIVSFVDYFCDECVSYNLEMSRLIRDHLSDTEFVLIPFPYTRPEKSLAISRGALCAAAQNKFIDFHMAAASRGDTLSNTTPADLAESGGIDVAAFNRCYYSGTGLAQLLARAQSEANRAGVLSTPVTFVNGKLFEGGDQFAAIRKHLQ